MFTPFISPYTCNCFYNETKDIKQVQERLGHSNIQTTINLYVHPTEEDIREDWNKVKHQFQVLIKGITMSIPINLPTNSTMINELCTLQSRTINIKGEVLITEIYDDYFLKMMNGTFQLLTSSSNFKIVSRTIKTKEKIFSLGLKVKI